MVYNQTKPSVYCRSLSLKTGKRSLLNFKVFFPVMKNVFRFMPPSIRWLFTHGRYDEGKAVVKRIAKRNRLPEPDINLLEGAIKKMNAEIKSEVKTSYLTLLTHRSTRVISLLLTYMWYVSPWLQVMKKE